MLKLIGTCSVAFLLSTIASLDAAAQEPAQCLGCHDFGPESPVHAVLEGSHGQVNKVEEAANRLPCEHCHGASIPHASAPTQVSPDISFGPRWSATIAAQDKQCLACHEGNIAEHWQDALHMINDLTCVTCHDVHSEVDKVLQPNGQEEVCTVCHKAQKQGIHALADDTDSNPQCTTCHNPHDHESAQTEMLKNRSEGCRSCHDLAQMAISPQVSPKANSYHIVMVQTDRSVLDCHQNIAHAAADSVPPMVPVAMRSKEVTLFFPGQADSEWLLSEHPGSQPLRQGRNCQQCHRSDEASMGSVQNYGKVADTRAVQVSFDQNATHLNITLQWTGPADDKDIALMWGDNSSDAFRRGGCFAACHSDMPGMSRDRGQQAGKYLLASRLQERRIGRPAIPVSNDALQTLLAAGNFVEMWRVNLADGGAIQSAILLAELDWRASATVSAVADYANGQWTVKIKRNRIGSDGFKDLNSLDRYTFGVALHGAQNAGGEHWVSLPMTLGFNSDDTDFRVQ